MSLKKRLKSIGMIAVVAGLIYVAAIWGTRGETAGDAEMPFASEGKDTLYLWYTDESLTSYLSGAAVTYNETHDVRVVPVLTSGLEYLETINEASLTEEVPDMFVVSHDSLEKAYLAGLAEEVKPAEGFVMENTYIGTGIQAATYKDKIIGYPFYFETSSLLYNKTYLEQMAQKKVEAEADLEAAQEAEKELEENGPEQGDGGRDEGMPDLPSQSASEEAPLELTEEEKLLVEQRMQELLPTTIEDIKTIADSYDAPEGVEAIFKWDVTDIFYNYFFIGDTINMGGEAGWDISQIDIYNENAIESMRAYEELNQFFSIDTSEIAYEKVIDEFVSGKVIFTVATTDVIAKLEQAKEDGLFAFEYGILETPDIDDNISTRSLSMTNCVAINGYGEHRAEANDFARFLTAEYSDILYARSGKVSAIQNADYGYEALQVFAKEYESSISMPKMIETSNFWVQLEVVFAQVWDGADANMELKHLSEQMIQQITGREYVEEYIREPEKQKEETESDEQDTES